MKYLLLSYLLISLIACKTSSKSNYVYYIDNSINFDSSLAKDPLFSKVSKFISYKNYLFEFASSILVQSSLVNSTYTSKQDINYTIFVMESKKDKVIEIDSLSENFKILKSLDFSKKTGLIIKDPEKNYAEQMKALNYKTKRDSTINNFNYIVVDTSFMFVDTMLIKSYYFFMSSPKINTIYNINLNDNHSSPYQFVGIKAISRDKIVTQFTLKDLSKLSSEDSKICESIINRLKKEKHL